MLTRVHGSRKQKHFNWRHIFFEMMKYGVSFFFLSFFKWKLSVLHQSSALVENLFVNHYSSRRALVCLFVRNCPRPPPLFFKKRKSIFQKGSYRNMLLIYNTSHNNRHQNQGEKFVSPLAWCAHTHTQNTTLQTPLSNQCEDFIGMCHFGCTTAVLHTYTHTYTHHQSRASHIQICTCSASALSLMIGLVSDVYCASLALSLSACLIQVRLVVSR